jgi:hypothetical protein
MQETENKIPKKKLPTVDPTRTIYYRQEGGERIHVIYVVFDLASGEAQNPEDLSKILGWWKRQVAIPKISRSELHGSNFNVYHEHNDSAITNIGISKNTIYFQKGSVLISQPNIESITLDANESIVTLKYFDESNRTIELSFKYTGILTKLISFFEF